MAKFICPVCDTFMKEMAPEQCPVCKVPGSKFQELKVRWFGSSSQTQHHIGDGKVDDAEMIKTTNAPLEW